VSVSLVQRSPTARGVSESDREASIMRNPWPTTGCCAKRKYCNLYLQYNNMWVTGLDWPRGFHEVKVPKFHDNGTEWW